MEICLKLFLLARILINQDVRITSQELTLTVSRVLDRDHYFHGTVT